jgi:GrpB-like predicted nucleotidyltransferase (UPF0157 family)
MAKEPVEIHEYTAEWAWQFREIGTALRNALADSAIRIDHIGSTSIPGLAATPIIDVQILHHSSRWDMPGDAKTQS